MNYEITFSQLEKLEKPKTIDIRTPEQFAHGSYPGAENIPREMLRPEDDRQPLMLSNLLQVLFNMADIAVVGQFAGSASLAAVGSTATAVALFTGIMGQRTKFSFAIRCIARH